jgi:two-component system, cell cycle response regulator DivK
MQKMPGKNPGRGPPSVGTISPDWRATEHCSPRDRPNGSIARRPGQGQEMMMATPPTVLIVEDNPLNMKMFAALVADRGYKVVEAPDGLTGLDLARKVRPQLIIMDLDLPGISGLAATRALKSDHETRRIPIVLTTATAITEKNPAVRDCGCDGFLPKPIAIDSFVSMVEGYMALAECAE